MLKQCVFSASLALVLTSPARAFPGVSVRDASQCGDMGAAGFIKSAKETLCIGVTNQASPSALLYTHHGDSINGQAGQSLKD